MSLKAPFPYFGGKRRVAAPIWQALGHPDNYIEPFCGSAAVLLARPRMSPWPPDGETVNDADGHLVNVWRAIQAAPDAMAAEIERLGPSQELTMHAVSAELVERREGMTERLRSDVEWHDPIPAARWIWGICQWIGSGWADEVSQKRPHLGNFGQGLFSLSNREHIAALLAALSQRLRHVRILCGDWSRCLTDSAMTKLRHGAPQGILLDPPYSHAMRKSAIYAEEMSCADAVANWCREHGEDPLLRICLCGVAGEHQMPSGWRYLDWSSSGMGGKQQAPERLLFSPHCLPVDGELPVDPAVPVPRRQATIFDLV